MSENRNLNAKMLPLTEQVLEPQIAGSYETIPKKYCFVIAMYFCSSIIYIPSVIIRMCFADSVQQLVYTCD